MTILRRTLKLLIVSLSLLTCRLSSAAIVQFSANGGGEIADADTTVFEFTISSEARMIRFMGENLTLMLIGVDHPFLGDLEVSLTHVPSNTIATAFYRVGAQNNTEFGYAANLSGNYSFNSGAVDNLWDFGAGLGDADAVPNGLYVTTGAFSSNANDFSRAFNGLNPSGVWRLTVTDHEADPGNAEFQALTNWALALNLEDSTLTPESGTLSLGALGIIGFIVAGRLRLLSAGR